jgi:hypothetical protein
MRCDVPVSSISQPSRGNFALNEPHALEKLSVSLSDGTAVTNTTVSLGVAVYPTYGSLNPIATTKVKLSLTNECPDVAAPGRPWV